MSQEDKERAYKMIREGKVNKEILEAFDGRCSISQIYSMRYAVKRSGGALRPGAKGM